MEWNKLLFNDDTVRLDIVGKLPFSAAMSNGVYPFVSVALTLAPFAIKASTTLTRPKCENWLKLQCMKISSWNAYSTVQCTLHSHAYDVFLPCCAASYNGVIPLLFGAFTFAWLRSKVSTTLSWPVVANKKQIDSKLGLWEWDRFWALWIIYLASKLWIRRFPLPHL